MNRILSVTSLTLTLILSQPAIGRAAEIRIWTARAIATVLAEIGPEFERTTGHKLIVTSDLPTGFMRRAKAGERFDLFISASSPVDEWIKEGKVSAETRTDIARSGIGVAVRAGSHKPDISSVEAFKRALLDAKSLAYLRIGSGLYLDSLIERFGIAEAIRAKATRPDSDIVCELVAKGEVELGIVVITQILTTRGVDLVGPLPPEIQHHVTFAGAVSATSRAPDAAKQLIEFLIGPTAIAEIKKQGMEPASRPVASQENRLSDKDQITAVISDWENAWNSHNMHALAELFHEDGTWILWTGQVWKGRTAIEEGHAAVHKTVFRNSVQRERLEELTFVGPDAAVVRFYSTLTGDERAPGKVIRSRKILIMIRRKGVWKVGWGQNTRLADATPD